MDTLSLSLVLLLPFLINTSHWVSALKTIYIADECNKQMPSQSQFLRYEFGMTSESNSSGILKASAYGGYVGNLNCFVSLKPTTIYGGGIILSFRKIDFRPNCIDNITIGYVSLWTSLVYCKSINDPMEHTSYSNEGDLIFTLHTGSEDAPSSFDGFELIYTVYSTPNCWNSEFECPKGCISKRLRCDGHNHCGDRSDQENCAYVEDLCDHWSSPLNPIQYEIGSTAEPESSGILAASRFGSYKAGLNCKIVLKSSFSEGIIISIEKIDFRPSCQDNITIVDAHGINQIYCGYKYDALKNSWHYSLRNVTIYYQTGKYDTSKPHGGFKLIYTAFNKAPCTSEEFQCPSGCISKNLKCDGNNHCGDRSDQNECYLSAEDDPISCTPAHIARIAAIVFGSLFLFAAVFASIMYYRKKYQDSNRYSLLHPFPSDESYDVHHPAHAMFASCLYHHYDPPPKYSPMQVQEGEENNPDLQ